MLGGGKAEPKPIELKTTNTNVDVRGLIVETKPHYLRTELYSKLEESGIFNLPPEALIYKDMEEVERICNEVLDNGIIDVVHSTNPIAPPQIVRRVNVIYDTDDKGFVIPESVNFRLFA